MVSSVPTPTMKKKFQLIWSTSSTGMMISIFSTSKQFGALTAKKIMSETYACTHTTCRTTGESPNYTSIAENYALTGIRRKLWKITLKPANTGWLAKNRTVGRKVSSILKSIGFILAPVKSAKTSTAPIITQMKRDVKLFQNGSSFCQKQEHLHLQPSTIRRRSLISVNLRIIMAASNRRLLQRWHKIFWLIKREAAKTTRIKSQIVPAQVQAMVYYRAVLRKIKIRTSRASYQTLIHFAVVSRECGEGDLRDVITAVYKRKMLNPTQG